VSWVVRLIVVLPVLAGLLGLLARRRRPVAVAVAVSVSAVVTALALAQWIAPSRTADIGTLSPLPVGDLAVLHA